MNSIIMLEDLLTTFIIFVCLSLIGFYLRTRTILRYNFVGDDSAYYKLLLSNKQNLIVVRKSNNLNLPPLFWKLTTFFYRRLSRYGKLFDLLFPLIDMGTGFSLFLFSLYFFNLNIYLSLAVFGLYMVYPQITYQMSIVTTRQMGHLFFFLTMVFFYLSLHHFSNYSINLFALQINISLLTLFISAIFYSATLLSHRLSTQMLWIVLIPMTFYYHYHTIFLLVFGTLLAILLSKGFYIKVLKGHIIIVHFYIVHLKKYYKRHLKDLLKTSPSYAVGIFASAISILLIEDQTFLKLWIIFVLLSALWWLWGDSERHLIYLIIPSILLLVKFLSTLQTLIGLIIWMCLFIYSLLLSLKYKPTHLDNELQELCKKIKLLPDNSIIFAFGYRRLLALCGNKPFILTNDGGNTEEIWHSKKELFDLDLNQIIEKYKVTHIVTKNPDGKWDLVPVGKFLSSAHVNKEK